MKKAFPACYSSARQLLRHRRDAGGTSRGRPRLEQLEDRTVPAPVVSEIIPINTAGLDNVSGIVNFNGMVLFAANGGSGTELWKSDGTNAGTVLVKDINPGETNNNPNSSSPLGLTVFGNAVYFRANNGTSGNELWKSDGTTAGTVMVKDINPGADSSFPDSFTVVGNTLFFNASNGTDGSELWKTDGTAAGTVMVKDINAGMGSSNPLDLTAVGGTLYFTATSGNFGREVWKSDGTSAGTLLLKDIKPGFNATSNPHSLTALGNTLYFTADDGMNGFDELWKSDGTEAGTVMVKDINPGAGNANAGDLTVLGNTLYFRANNGTTGSELWKSDGTAAGTVLVKDINPGGPNNNPDSSSPGGLTAVGGTLYFSADDGVTGRELWKSDGTAAGTVLVKDINPGETNNNPNSSGPINLVAQGSTLYFAAIDGTNGYELWTSDGTTAGTVLAKDIIPGADGSNPAPTQDAVVGNRVFFPANVTATRRSLFVAQSGARIVSITSTTANGTYGLGAQINVTVTFDMPVTLAGGNLTIPLNSGGSVTIAPFTNQTTVSGTYTVAAGQNANPLDTTAPLVLAAGATLRDANGNNVALTIPPGMSLRDSKALIINSSIKPAFNFDKLGAYRPGDGSWSLDSDGTFGFSSSTDQVFLRFSPPNVQGVAGDWDGDGRDSIGDFANGTWHIDLNDNGIVDANETFTFGQAGDKPVVGDWNGDGRSKFGVFRTSPDGFSGTFILDTNNNRMIDAGDESFIFGAANDRVVVGDWTGDGKTKVGVFRDAASAGAPGAAIFTLDLNNNKQFDGGDQIFIFGTITDGLVVGDWNGNGIAKVGVYRDGGPAMNAPGVALFSLDTNGNRGFDQGVDDVFLYGTLTDQFVGGNWKVTPPLQPSSREAFVSKAQQLPVQDAVFAQWSPLAATLDEMERRRRGDEPVA